MSRLLLLSLMVLFGGLAASAQNYNKLMGKAIKKAIGNDLKGYETFSYPTDNYGLITSFDNKSTKAKNFICDMWNCIGLERPTESTADWLSMKGFAAVGAGGSVELTDKEKKTFALKVLLPKIYDVVGVTASVENEKTANVTLSIGKAYIRMLRKKPILDFIKTLNKSYPLREAFDENRLAIIVADCVIDGLSVTVEVDQKKAAEFDSKFNLPANTVAGKILSDGELSLSVSKNNIGSYTFKVNHPVIYARLAKKQPASGELSEIDDKALFEDWETVADGKTAERIITKK